MTPLLLAVTGTPGPDPFLQSLISTTVVASIIGALSVIVQVILNKRLRAPSDRLAEAQFSVKVYQDQVAEARLDKELNDKTIQTLRDYVSKLEVGSRADQQMITDLYKQIRALEDRNGQKDSQIRDFQGRIDLVALKVSRGEQVLLTDLEAPRMPS